MSENLADLLAQRKALKKDLKAAKEAKSLAIAKNVARLFSATQKGEKGLRRMILPEHYRPFIQKLSAAAGRVARADLKNVT